MHNARNVKERLMRMLRGIAKTVRFHPNSLYVATGSADRTCRLWDTQTGSCVRVFVGHSGAVSTIALSPDGRYLASAGESRPFPSAPGLFQRQGSCVIVWRLSDCCSARFEVLCYWSDRHTDVRSTLRLSVCRRRS